MFYECSIVRSIQGVRPNDQQKNKRLRRKLDKGCLTTSTPHYKGHEPNMKYHWLLNNGSDEENLASLIESHNVSMWHNEGVGLSHMIHYFNMS